MNGHYSEGLKQRKDYEPEEILEGLIDRHYFSAVTWAMVIKGSTRRV